MTTPACAMDGCRGCGMCDPGGAEREAQRRDALEGGPVVGHVSPARGVTHRVEPGSTWEVRQRPADVRRVAERVRRQLRSGEHPSLDEVKILVDALLDG